MTDLPLAKSCSAGRSVISNPARQSSPGYPVAGQVQALPRSIRPHGSVTPARSRSSSTADGINYRGAVASREGYTISGATIPKDNRPAEIYFDNHRPIANHRDEQRHGGCVWEAVDRS